ncbi:hypothetical protein E6W26_28945 [Pseudomonas aeruginosa]|uniref:hypothetical protein n=1 Tax=Pseudomonas aeruginosa TaxID=287 RepID=UPI00109D97AB|nr:hypothetical protein [Pseudomonas aeruginosa]EKV1241299.1 hypothetical protein [Pseudomonas aeruginosa]EKV8586208.1 hypothetical protein [Pseudomonas aeruginosa]ELN5407426.1 hypothetical protein [Pseudomonas aeruginosa]ELP1438617.1 hypothetical protein [Pseudomonas aeruginosa]THB16427.1 hypothetical protein E6W26_28945 [Pseudomonas aeruginosa]
MNNELENNKVIEYGESFKKLYSDAKVRSTEVLCSKATIILPLFIASANKDTKLDDKVVTVVIPDEDLTGTGYSGVEFSGMQLNAYQHLDFYLFLNALSQRVGGSKITISVREMLPHIGRHNDDFHIYNKYFVEFLNRIRHSRVKYTIKSKMLTIDANLIGNIVEVGDGVYVINMGEYMIDSLTGDTYTKKIGIKNDEDVQAGITRLLKIKLSVMTFKGFGEFSVDTMFSVLGLKRKIKDKDCVLSFDDSSDVVLSPAEVKKRNKAERDSNFKMFNRAVKNLMDLGFIISAEPCKKFGKKEISSYKFTINEKFDDQKLNDDPFGFVYEHPETESSSSVTGEPLIENPLAAIESMFANMGCNPEAIEHERVIAERMRKDVEEKSVAGLTNAMAKKAQKQ